MALFSRHFLSFEVNVSDSSKALNGVRMMEDSFLPLLSGSSLEKTPRHLTPSLSKAKLSATFGCRQAFHTVD